MESGSNHKKDTSEILSMREGSVFLVDDNSMYLNILEAALKKVLPNATVFCFQSGEKAIAELDRKPFLILLDYDLAGVNPNVMNGISVLKAIKKVCADTQVIMLSGVEDAKIITTSMKHGAFDYIIKGEKAMFDVRHRLTSILRKMRITDEKHEEVQVQWFLRWIAIVLVIAFIIGFIIYGI